MRKLKLFLAILLTACILWTSGVPAQVVVPPLFSLARTLVDGCPENSMGVKTLDKVSTLEGQKVTFFIKYFKEVDAIGVGLSSNIDLLAAEFYFGTGRVCAVYSSPKAFERQEVKTPDELAKVFEFVSFIINALTGTQSASIVEG